jgi:hypothetical protein
MISSGWATFKKNWKFIILVGLATAVIEIILNMIQRGLQGHIIAGLLAAVLSMIITIVIGLGWVKVLLSLNRTGSVTWATFETSRSEWLCALKVFVWYILRFAYYFIITVLPFLIIALIGFLTHVYALVIIGGILAYIAFLVSAIYVGLRYQFMYYVVLDNPELRSKAIFKKAGDLTKGSLLQLLGFGIVLFFYNILGLICLVVGLVVTIPVSKLAHAKVYDFLKEKHTHQN